jgi:hypothetical protein
MEAVKARRLRRGFATAAAALAVAAPVAMASPAGAAPAQDGVVRAQQTCRSYHVVDKWGQASGRICWSGPAGSVSINGKVADYKQNPSSSYLHVKWKAVGKSYDNVAQGAGNGQTASISRQWRFPGSPGGVQVVLCSKVGSKAYCGTAQRF